MNWLPTIPEKNPTTVFARLPMPMMLRVLTAPAPMTTLNVPEAASASCDNPAIAPAIIPAVAPLLSAM